MLSDTTGMQSAKSDCGELYGLAGFFQQKLAESWGRQRVIIYRDLRDILINELHCMNLI